MNDAPPQTPQPVTPDREDPREIRSEDLLRGRRVVVIMHEGERYRLVLTRNGKLLLQK